ncbi:hypothetical protein [Edaphocola aurantiacus]|uniref:hypothetical protein n=1 Tax=Edaphocola aurantiacus TaxID=2601682 RepID=UPI001C96E75A|nr:hypothetical protein [Edaphocola aurantiacus]
MKKTGIIFLCIATSLLSCSKDMFRDPATVTLSDGTYVGTFQRQTLASSLPSAVSLTLSNGNWTGNASMERYPALCSGTYTIGNNQVQFEDTCTWSANFDWTLILDGTYEITQYDDTLVLTRQQGNTTVDIYKLKKQ